MTAILGINAYHADASACLLQDGVLVAAVEEERFKRVKHWAGLPSEAIRYCLREAGISMKDVSVIAINSNPRVNRFRKLLYTIAHRPDFRLLHDRLRSRAKRRTVSEDVSRVLGDHGFRGEVNYVEHHLAHLASTFFTSPYEKAIALSVDGFGDFASTAWGVGERNELRIDERIYFPHSLGIFYEAVTRFLGFKTYGDEYRVMGLAAYGQDNHEREMTSLVELRENGRFGLNLDYFNHHHGGEVMTWDGCEPVTGDHYAPALCDLLGKPRSQEDPITQRHKDIACSTQAMYERALFHIIRHLHAVHAVDSLVLSGGCAFNSLANGKIRRNTPVDSTFIQAAAGDAGGALGAALHTWNMQMGEARSFSMDHAYWGPGYSDEEIDQRISGRREDLARQNCRWGQLGPDELVSRVASAIASGQVVGWFQGRMEWGPRALGNRSILCDPRRSDMKDVLNKKIKCRELFRPFAPSILREAVNEWFEEDDSVPFMMKVLQIRSDRREFIPAVTHVDGSGRLQTVERYQNPLFYGLIEAFNDLTGVPMLLNTSFNQNEPIVCSVDEAINCFRRTRMDMLVLGHHFLVRNDRLDQEARGRKMSDSIPEAN